MNSPTDFEDPKHNPRATDAHALEAVAWLTAIMRNKVNPDFSRETAWRFYLENRERIREEQKRAEERNGGPD